MIEFRFETRGADDLPRQQAEDRPGMARKTARRKVGASRRAARRLVRVKFKRCGPSLTGAQITIMAGFLANLPLPSDYRAFLRKSNGGDPDPAHFVWHHPAEGERTSHVDCLLGLDPRPLDDPGRSVDVIRVALTYRDELPRGAIPIGFVDRDNLLLMFVVPPHEGQVWIKIWCEVPITIDEPWNPDAGAYPLAESFREFLLLLKDIPQEA